jgi:hypothetical protein
VQLPDEVSASAPFESAASELDVVAVSPASFDEVDELEQAARGEMSIRNEARVAVFECIGQVLQTLSTKRNRAAAV